MGTWRNLFKKVVRYLSEAFSFLDREDKPHWGISGGIAVMMESRSKVERAADPAQIAKLYYADPRVALERYGGQEMEFNGTVVQCQKSYDSRPNLWAVWINVKNIDVIVYFRGAIHVGEEITVRGTCAGFQDGSRVTVVLNPAKIFVTPL